jgi:hypothetical protein
LKQLFLVITLLSVVTSASVAQQFYLDDRTQGTWIRTTSGHKLSFKRDGSAVVTMQGSLRNFSDPQARVDRCTDKPGTICLTTNTFGRCSFQHTIRHDGVMNLLKTDGANICDDLAGDYVIESQ